MYMSQQATIETSPGPFVQYYKTTTYQEARTIVINQLCGGGEIMPLYPIILYGSGSNGKSFLLNDIKLIIKECGYQVFNDNVNKIPIKSKKVIYCMNSIANIKDLLKVCFIVDMNSIKYIPELK